VSEKPRILSPLSGEKVTSEDEHERRVGSGEHGRSQLPRKRARLVLTEMSTSNGQFGLTGVDTKSCRVTSSFLPVSRRS